jgi:PPOX class probable F420-dependent enzyme
MVEMTSEEIRSFLRRGTFTGKLATTRKDVSPHVAPVWFVLDEDSNNTDIILTTWHESLKAKNIIRDPRASISVDDQTPPYSFVIINGVAEISEEPNDLLKWATKIAERYVGPDKAEAYGRRNSVKGELLIRVKPKNIIGQKDVAG